MPKPTYANFVNVRTTLTELVLDFGFFEDGSTPSESAEPEVRVVMSIGAIRRLGELLLKAAEEHDKMAVEEQPRPPAEEQAQ